MDKPIHNNPWEHKWVENYYGYECACGMFVPFGSEPWVDAPHDNWENMDDFEVEYDGFDYDRIAD